MSAIIVTCKQCGTRIKMNRAPEMGKQVKCPKCGAPLAPATIPKGSAAVNKPADLMTAAPVEEEPAAATTAKPTATPAAGGSKKSSFVKWLVLGLAACGLLFLCCAGVGVGGAGWYLGWFSGGGKNDVSFDTFNRVETGMTVEQVDAILGKGKPIDAKEVPNEEDLRNLGQQDQFKVQDWYVYSNDKKKIHAGFSMDPSAKVLRLTVVGYRGPMMAGLDVEGSAKKTSPLAMLPKLKDQDKGGGKTDKDTRLTKTTKGGSDPKPGTPAALILGKWQASNNEPVKDTIEFKKDGTVTAAKGGFGFNYKYKLIDGQNVELETTTGTTVRQRYQLSVTTDSLSLTAPKDAKPNFSFLPAGGTATSSASVER